MFQLFRKKAGASSLVGLTVGESQFSVAEIRHERGGPFLRQCVRIDYEGQQQLRELLPRQIVEMGLSGAPCNCVMSSRDYNVYLVEAPEVEQEELRAAVRWKVKDLLDVPSDDAAIDLFPLPEDAFQGRSRMLYVVSALRTRVRQLIETVERAGLNLRTLDVPEMAMRNISNRYADDSNGLAFLSLKKSGSSLNLSRGGELYLTRKINTQLDEGVMDSPDWDNLRDRLVLEIQRSLDYYESQMGQNPISRLLLAPRAVDGVALAESLNEAMAVSVSMLDFTDDLEADPAITRESQYACMTVIGAALRNDAAVTE